jgi:hypothetical protein
LIVGLFAGNWLNKFLMVQTFKRWRRLYEHAYSPQDFEVAFKTKAYVSKNHPRHFQKKVTQAYQDQLSV